MKNIYLGLTLSLMLLSLSQGNYVPIQSFWLPHWIILGIVVIVFIIGMIKLKKTLSKTMLTLSSIYYAILAIIVFHKQMDSILSMLIILTLIPILTSKILQHVGLANRMAVAFWFVVAILMIRKIYPPIEILYQILIIGISYYLQMVTIFFNSIENYSINESAWTQVKSRNPNLDFYNATHFDRKE